MTCIVIVETLEDRHKKTLHFEIPVQQEHFKLKDINDARDKILNYGTRNYSNVHKPALKVMCANYYFH